MSNAFTNTFLDRLSRDYGMVVIDQLPVSDTNPYMTQYRVSVYATLDPNIKLLLGSRDFPLYGSFSGSDTYNEYHIDDVRSFCEEIRVAYDNIDTPMARSFNL